MCLGVPAKILKVETRGEQSLGPIATVDFQGSRTEVSLAMTPDAKVDDWILVHAGFALTVLDEDEAKETWETLKELLDDGVDAPEFDPPS